MNYTSKLTDEYLVLIDYIYTTLFAVKSFRLCRTNGTSFVTFLFALVITEL
jgi:hypothetical protein